MKGIINFCKITYHDYAVEALPNGGLRATIECVYPCHVRKIKEMAEDRGYTVDTTEYGEVVIYSEEGWEEIMGKNQSKCVDKKQTKKENITIKNRHGQEFDFDIIRDHMDNSICILHDRELESTSPQDYYNKYCKLHKEIWSKDFFVEGLVVKNKYGEPLEYEEAVEYMDDDIREYLHHQLAPCSAQYFYDEYCKMHKEIHGEDFEDEYFTEGVHIIW